eukprot:935248-Amphidinium_carterae.1
MSIGCVNFVLVDSPVTAEAGKSLLTQLLPLITPQILLSLRWRTVEPGYCHQGKGVDGNALYIAEPLQIPKHNVISRSDPNRVMSIPLLHKVCNKAWEASWSSSHAWLFGRICVGCLVCSSSS